MVLLCPHDLALTNITAAYINNFSKPTTNKEEKTIWAQALNILQQEKTHAHELETARSHADHALHASLNSSMCADMEQTLQELTDLVHHTSETFTLITRRVLTINSERPNELIGKTANLLRAEHRELCDCLIQVLREHEKVTAGLTVKLGQTVEQIGNQISEIRDDVNPTKCVNRAVPHSGDSAKHTQVRPIDEVLASSGDCNAPISCEDQSVKRLPRFLIPFKSTLIRQKAKQAKRTQRGTDPIPVNRPLFLDRDTAWHRIPFRQQFMKLFRWIHTSKYAKTSRAQAL